MSDDLIRIAVMRRDGLHYKTDLRGWNAEIIAIRLFAEAKADPKTICVVWFEGTRLGDLEPRQQHWNAS